MAPASLRGRLLLLLLAAVGATWAGTALYSYHDARREIGALLDAHLEQSAGLLIAQIGHELEEFEESDFEDPRGSHKYARKVAFQVWAEEEGLLLRSAGAPRERLSAQAEGFSDSLGWRVFGRWTRGHEGRRVLVQVGEHQDFREELARTMTGHLLHPLWVALPLLGLLIWLAVGQGLRPLGRLKRQLAERAPDHLAPLDAGAAPREVAPLVLTLNALLARVAAALEGERRFTADAAHELRTPLAALRAQAQVAQGATDDAQRRRAIAQILAGCDRATRLVEQLLTLARLDPQQAASRLAPQNLHAIVAEVLAEQGARAIAKGVDVELEADPLPGVHGDAVMLGVLVRNLADNAIRYTPPGGHVRVALRTAGAGVLLEVCDDGPGVGEAERARLGQRFFRVLGSGEEGSGLGLSIVRRIAELHGAELALDAGPGGRGLRASVRFPARPQA